MKPTKLSLVPVALACFAFVPTTGITDDVLKDLEVTMEVFDDLSRIDGDVQEIRRGEETGIAAENAGSMDDGAQAMEDDAGLETDVYDNGGDQDIGGGSIVIHAK